jgi:hypothetical protein
MNAELFDLGHVVATQGALSIVNDFGPYIRRHVTGDWGTCGRYAETDLTANEVRLGCLATDDDAKVNVHAIRYGGRVMSAYNVPGGRLWVITDGLDAGGHATADTVTTCLLPDEY